MLDATLLNDVNGLDNKPVVHDVISHIADVLVPTLQKMIADGAKQINAKFDPENIFGEDALAELLISELVSFLAKDDTECIADVIRPYQLTSRHCRYMLMPEWAEDKPISKL